MEKQALLDKILKIHKDMLGFDNIDKCKQEDIETYLQYNEEQLNSLSDQDCEIISIKLLQHSLYVKRKINCVKAAHDWMVFELRKIISREIRNLKGVSWENAEQIIINSSEAACMLQENIQNYKMMLTVSNDIVDVLNHFSKKIDGLKFNKKGHTL